MEHTAVKRPVLDSAYQNKLEELFPTIEISTAQVKKLKDKQFNELFPISAVVRVTGMYEREVAPGLKEPFYTLEIRDVDVLNKDTEDMSPEEIRDKIEKTVEENME